MSPVLHFQFQEDNRPGAADARWMETSDCAAENKNMMGLAILHN